MDKVKIDNNAFVYPLPMVLAGAMKLGSDGFGVGPRQLIDILVEL